jgi:hypothetical protein
MYILVRYNKFIPNTRKTTQVKMERRHLSVYKYCICLDTTTIIDLRRVWRYQEVIRICKSKDRQHNMAKRKSTNNQEDNVEYVYFS